jgi:hypothetical protein
MSQENVHIIRRANEALNRGDIVGSMAEFFAPNVVYFGKRGVSRYPSPGHRFGQLRRLSVGDSGH